MTLFSRQVDHCGGVTGPGNEAVQDSGGLQTEGAGVDAWMRAEPGVRRDLPVDIDMQGFFPVVHQAQNADRAGGDIQIVRNECPRER